jgi:glutaminyl-tRNA synthetase
MPTLSAVRRRGYTPESIRDFCDKIGVAKRENLIDVGLLEFCVREHLNKIALRRMVVFDPLRVIITNFEEGKVEMMESEDNPEAEEITKRTMPFSRELYIEREDFMENPPKKYFRLAPGQMVRLKSAYIIRCDNVVKDSSGNVKEVHCTYIPESRSGSDTSGINVKGTLHWVSVQHALKIEARMYDRLFKVEDLGQAEGDFKDYLNPDSLQIDTEVFAEPALASAKAIDRFQFLRKGYFCLDPDSKNGRLVFNRTVTLRDMWAKK